MQVRVLPSTDIATLVGTKPATVTVAPVKFDRDHGFYDSAFDVKITTDTPGATIRYTTDGSAPTSTTGFIYSTPVHITTTTTLRAAAYLAGLASPNVHTESYIFLDSVIHQPRTQMYQTRVFSFSCHA